MKRVFALSVLAAILAACTSGGAVPTAAPSSISAPSGRPAKGGKVRAAVVIRVPKHRHRRHHYVSPSSQSGSLLIVPAGGCTTCTSQFSANFGLSVSSPNCSLGADGLTCTIPMALAVGTYVGSITLYDGPISGGNTSGNVLSANQSFPMTVAPGASNVPTITLDGVPSYATVTSLDANAFASYSQLYGELIEVTPGTRSRIEITADDPDGNVILGPGSPSFALTGGGGFSLSPLGGNVYLLSAPAPMRGTVTTHLSISSPLCSEPDADCTDIESNTYAFGVFGFAASSNGSNAVVVGGLDMKALQISQGISGPAALAFDSKADLFVANQTTNTVTEYAYPYTAGPIATISNGIATPNALVFDSANNLYVSNGTGSVEIYAAGNYAGTPITLSPTSDATGLGLDPAGRLWVLFTAGLARFPAPLTSPSEDQGIFASSPTSLCFDSVGGLYVVSGGKVAGYAYNGTQFTLQPQPPLTGVTGLASFNPPNSSNTVVAVESATALTYETVDTAGNFFGTTSAAPNFGGGENVAYDQWGTAYVATPSAGAVEYTNQYTKNGYYFSVPNATGIAAYP